jgi:signal transduction histidine kinase
MTQRLVLSYLVITVLVLAVLMIPLGVTNQRRQLQEVTSGIERDAFVLASFVEDGLEAGALAATTVERIEAYADQVGSRVVVVDGEGDALLDTAPPEPGDRTFATRPEVEQALNGEVNAGTRRSDTLDTDLVYAAVPVASGGLVRGAVRVTYPTAEVDARSRRYWIGLAGVASVSLVVVAGVGVVIARSITRPLREIEEAASDLGEGDLSRRVPEGRGPEEVRSLASAFNRTTARLEELVGSQEAFVADASHQLRTPLTALRLRLENLQADVDGEAAVDLQDAVAETERLARIVDGLLVLARADRGGELAPGRRIQVGPLLEARAESWRPFAEERSVTVEVEPRPRATVVADPERLTQVLDNLVANALDVSPAGSTIVLRAVPSNGRTAVHVVDAGPGLTPEERARAFDRFWQAEPGRKAWGGSGLGLAIVAKLVAADGGQAWLDAAPQGGVDAVVELPA